MIRKILSRITAADNGFILLDAATSTIILIFSVTVVWAGISTAILLNSRIEQLIETNMAKRHAVMASIFPEILHEND